MTHPSMIRPEDTIVLYSGFPRRGMAFFADIIILGIFGSILGMFFFRQFCDLGSNGPLLGLAIAWGYFGLQNSALFRGQTPGKRLLQIKVVSREGNYLSPARSFLRYGIFGVPYFVGAPLNVQWSSPLATALVSIFVLTWYLTMAYLVLFNRPSRQGLHDLVAGSYVVKTISMAVPGRTPFWKPHIAILGIVILLELGIGSFGSYLGRNYLASLLALQKVLLSQPNIQSADVMEGINTSMGSGSVITRKTLSVSVRCHEKPDNVDGLARQLAAVVLHASPAVAEKQDVIVITVSYGYDIGIASSTNRKSISKKPSDWSRMVQDSAVP